MNRVLPLMLALCTFAHSQDKPELPPQIDSVTVAWDEDSATGHTATLRWSEQLPEPPGIKVNRYRVYRAPTVNGLFKLKAGTSQGVTIYLDKTVFSGKTYWYYVTALATNGQESGPSTTVATTIP